MSLLTFLLVLLVIAGVVYGIKLAFQGAWQELIYLIVALLVTTWILGIFGISLPNLPIK
jgi:hypothetical protein